MKVLVIGSGGREHALGWKLAASPRVARVYVAPGNAGTALEPKLENVPIAASDSAALRDFARAEHIELTVVGPEAPLVAGLVDSFQDAGLRILGPTRAAARLEGSKAYTKAFLARHGIATGRYETFTDAAAAKAYVQANTAPIVVKADGLAGGKGVVVARSEAQALAAIEEMLVAERFEAAGRRIVIEEFLQGEEASFIALVDTQGHVLPFASSQDHKARDDGDRGPNTGGMGAYSPAPAIDDVMHARIMREVIQPTVAGMAAEGNPYAGFLYAGLMVDEDGTPRVLEYNCRFGDPETQPIMLRLACDFSLLCDAAVDGRLDEVETNWDKRTALGVVMAAGGYPGDYRKGDVIAGLEHDTANTKVFHAGTAQARDGIVTAGGRVLCVCALGDDAAAAQAAAYARVKTISWDDAYYRTDIGHRAVNRL